MAQIDTQDIGMGCFFVFVIVGLFGLGFAAGFISHATGYYPSSIVVKWGAPNE